MVKEVIDQIEKIRIRSQLFHGPGRNSMEGEELILVMTRMRW